MGSLIEDYASRLSWRVRSHNVLVEGTSDVGYVDVASGLYLQTHQASLLGPELSILAAGRADEGGVDGVNRRLNAARQIADADRDAYGAITHRFTGLFDNDRAGRRALSNACAFDRRLKPYKDLFLLHPIMPPCSGATCEVVKARADTLNAPYGGLDWEIEDLLGDALMQKFVMANPQAVERITCKAGKVHRDFTKDGKRELLRFARNYATLEDMSGVIALVASLRDYMSLPNTTILS